MLSVVILPRVLSVKSFLFDLIFLPVLPNGPIHKVCVIISEIPVSIVRKKKQRLFNTYLCFSVKYSGMDNILESIVILISLD